MQPPYGPYPEARGDPSSVPQRFANLFSRGSLIDDTRVRLDGVNPNSRTSELISVICEFTIPSNGLCWMYPLLVLYSMPALLNFVWGIDHRAVRLAKIPERNVVCFGQDSHREKDLDQPVPLGTGYRIEVCGAFRSGQFRLRLPERLTPAFRGLP